MLITAFPDQTNFIGDRGGSAEMEYLALIYSVLLLVAMLACLEFGRRYALKKAADEADSASAGKKIVEGAFFGLLSLLIAFTFSGSISRFDQRRALIIDEANDTGTAYLRVDLLPPEVQPQMRELFRSYLDSRLAIFHAIPDLDAARRELAHSIELQDQIWELGVASTRAPGAHPNAGVLVINALNSMIDTANSRTWSALTHPPLIVYGLLFVIALICSFIAGNSLAAAKTNAWMHVLAFALLTCVSVYVILEIEFPRVGFIEIEKYDQALIDVRTSMK
jgi:hypothetical protein